jgi:dihydrofolate synthase/folylpolyglutamate synthase
MTHLAFLWFDASRADAAVLEVGMGGRLDATNVVAHPVACAVTIIGLDHTAILGETLAEIATEKAGILKAGSPAVVAPQRPEAAAAIRAVAEETGVALQWMGAEVSVHSSDDGTFTVQTPSASYENVSVPLLGGHQRQNAAVAVALAEHARMAGFDRIDRDAVRRGLASVRWPGRIQRIGDSPAVYLDGAHNAESIDALTHTLAHQHPASKPIYVFGVADDKDWRAMLRIMAPRASAIAMTRTGNPRSVSPEVLADAAREIGFPSVSVQPDPHAALEEARAAAGKGGLVVATGSLYLVGTILSSATKEALRPY